MVFSGAGLLEALGWKHGVKPCWSIGSDSWCLEASELGQGDIAIIGSSRALSAVEPRLLSSLVGRSARQLAINATATLPVLEWLADREDFAGVVLADVTPRLEFRSGFERHAAAIRFLQSLQDFRRSPGRRLEARLSRLVQSRVRFKPFVYHVVALFWNRYRDGGGPLSGMTVEDTRFVRLAYGANAKDSDRNGVNPLISPPAAAEEVEELMNRFARAVRAIRRRGGQVVFLFMPSSGVVAAREERLFPRREYWDRLAAATAAEAIHFEDVPVLSSFRCPDGEHLDWRDALRFTQGLAKVLGKPR